MITHKFHKKNIKGSLKYLYVNQIKIKSYGWLYTQCNFGPCKKPIFKNY